MKTEEEIKELLESVPIWEPQKRRIEKKLRLAKLEKYKQIGVD